MRTLYNLLPWRKPDQQALANAADDHGTHLYLGNMYLALGHTAQAEAEYARAHALRRSEQTGKQLAAIRRQHAEQGHSADRFVPAGRAA